MQIKSRSTVETKVTFTYPSGYKPITVVGDSVVAMWVGDGYTYFTPDDARFIADLLNEAADVVEQNAETAPEQPKPVYADSATPSASPAAYEHPLDKSGGSGGAQTGAGWKYR